MDKIYEILNDLRPEFDFSQSNNYIEDGMLDSFDLIALVSELDRFYGISIDGLDVVPENFINAEAIMNIVRKSGGKI